MADGASDPPSAQVRGGRGGLDAVLGGHQEPQQRVDEDLAARQHEERHDEQNGVPPLVQAAIENLRAVAAKRLESGEDAEARIVEILARAAQDIRKA